MDDFHAFELASLDLGCGEAGDAAGKLSAIQVANPDDVPGLKLAFAAGDARGQQASAVFAESFFRAGIDEQGAFRMVKEGNPTFAALKAAGCGDEEGPLFLTG